MMKTALGDERVAAFLRSAVRFGILSVFSFGLNMGTAVLLHEVFGVAAEIAVLVALVTVLVTNFLACRYIVFDARSGSISRQASGFILTTAAFRGAEYLSFLFFHTLLGVQYLVAFVPIISVSSLLKFLFYRTHLFTSRGKVSPADEQ